MATTHAMLRGVRAFTTKALQATTTTQHHQLQALCLFTAARATAASARGGVPFPSSSLFRHWSSSPSPPPPPEASKDEDRRYHWIKPEAEDLIARAYARHKALANTGKSFPPSICLKDLESDTIATEYHYEPKTFGDRVARKLVYYGENLMHMFFRDKYDHHAVTLETVAAVPGIVGAAHRHLRSLRCMKRDHGWINPLQEEAENERLHLLIWMQHTKPSRIERAFVVMAQGAYVLAYSVLMYLSPRTAHRTVGYLEEAAHRAYTDYLNAVDRGDIPNVPAGDIAKRYYRLPEDAKLRDVILHVRADECMHRDFNHHLGDLYDNNEADAFPTKMGGASFEEDRSSYELKEEAATKKKKKKKEAASDRSRGAEERGAKRKVEEGSEIAM
jgi:ubiquinol oxidase